MRALSLAARRRLRVGAAPTLAAAPAVPGRGGGLLLRPFSAEATSGIAAPALGTTPKTAEGARQLYDAWATDYDATLRSWKYPAPRRTAELLCEYLPAGTSREQAVLDAGCGTGLSGEALAELGFTKLVGTDISPDSFKVTAQKSIYERLEVANLEETLPFEDDAFQAIVCVGVLSYVNAFDGLFAEFCRVTKPGGIVVFTHRMPFWDDDVNNVRTVAEAQQGWTRLFASGPEDYMPNNPDPTENAKKIQYIIHKVC